MPDCFQYARLSGPVFRINERTAAAAAAAPCTTPNRGHAQQLMGGSDKSVKWPPENGASHQTMRRLLSSAGRLFQVMATVWDFTCTYSTVYYASVTSIIHCRACCNFLISWCHQQSPSERGITSH